MTFRIITDREDGGHVVRLAGDLRTEGAPALLRVLAGLPGPVRVDCTDLRAIDEAGLAVLRTLPARGVRLTGVSPYWRLRLQPDVED